MRSAALVREGRISLALSWAREFAVPEPDTVPVQYTLACIHEITGDANAERAALDATLRIDPDFPQARNMRGALRRRLEDYVGAIEDFTAVIEALPADLTSREGRGLSFLLQGNPEQALVDFQRVLSDFPGRLEAALGCAEALDDLGRSSESVSVIFKALREWPPGSVQHAQLDGALRQFERE